jgi:hypothetical protein
MWALVQKNRGGRCRSIGREDAGEGFGQARQPLTHPQKTRCGKGRPAAESQSQARRAMQCKHGMDCRKLRGWIRGSEAASGSPGRSEQTRTPRQSGPEATRAVRIEVERRYKRGGAREQGGRQVPTSSCRSAFIKPFKPCLFLARAAAPQHITGAAPPCAQDSPGCCRRDMPYEGPKSTF